jgi:PKD repeat protein
MKSGILKLAAVFALSLLAAPAFAGQNPPVACFTWAPSAPYVGAYVAFNAACSNDSDGTIVSYEWDFCDGGTATGPAPYHAFFTPPDCVVMLVVTDNDGKIGVYADTVPVVCYGENCREDN